MHDARGEDNFHFAACGGQKMDDLGRQLQDLGGDPDVIWAMSGGNDAFFGLVARACIFQPKGKDWGPAWDEDPDGVGECKKNIAIATDYLENNFEEEFRNWLDTVLEQKFKNSEHPDKRLDLFFSSYTLFFNDQTEECDEWTFVHSSLSNGRPKLVKALRTIINDKTALLNKIQADVIASYKPLRENHHVHHAEASPLYDGHRFCEPGHTFDDQFYHEDVWLWNLQFWDTKSEAAGREASQQKDGVTFMAGNAEVPSSHSLVFPLAEEYVAEYGEIFNKQQAEAEANGEGELITQGSSRSIGWTTGWISRPLHPKFAGHRAMKDHFIEAMIKEKIPGVVGGNSGDPTDNMECNELGDRYVPRETLRRLVEDQFCPTAVEQGTLDKDSGSLMRKYYEGTVDETHLALEWTPDLPYKPTMEDCKQYLMQAVDACSLPDTDTNPFNLKAGGRVTAHPAGLAGPVGFVVAPMSETPRLPARDNGERRALCLCDGLRCDVGGAGFATGDGGARFGELLAAKCRRRGRLGFAYGVNEDAKLEWTSSFECDGRIALGITPQDAIDLAVSAAIEEAGGPRGVKCDRAG
jgi:hypothetical protein